MRILALIPAYNEEGNIERVIINTRRHLPIADILIVNDCSTDNTKKVLIELKLKKASNIHILNLPFNLGIGGAVWTGFHYFLEKKYDFLIRIDGDGQHPPSMAEKLLNPVINGEADVVIGSRFLSKEKPPSPLLRRWGIKLLNLLTSFILRINITDNTSGFRAYNKSAIQILVQDYPFDYPEPEEIYLLSRKGLKIKEVPVIMEERKEGVSSINVVHTYYYLIKIIMTIVIKYLIGGKK